MTRKKIFIVICILILLIIIASFLGLKAFNHFNNKYSFEKHILDISNKNKKTVFSINKITFFSSCNSDVSIKSNSSFILENLYQYTDIGIFLDTNSEEFTPENTLKKVYIDNITFNNSPEIGTPALYYKDLNKFATADFSKDDIISDSLEFNISSENQIDYSTPTLYNNCANPITLSYINSGIKTDYAILDTGSELTYDGNLLKKCNVLLNSISCNLSFDIYIVNNLDQEFKCSVSFDIPLKDDNSSIYDGNFVLNDETNYTFYRYK